MDDELYFKLNLNKLVLIFDSISFPMLLRLSSLLNDLSNYSKPPGTLNPRTLLKRVCHLFTEWLKPVAPPDSVDFSRLSGRKSRQNILNPDRPIKTGRLTFIIRKFFCLLYYRKNPFGVFNEYVST